MGVEQFGKGNVWASAKEAGIWRNIPFLASNFNAVTSTWTIIKTDIITNRYCRIGNTIIWVVDIGGSSSFSGALTSSIFIKAPVKNFNLLYKSMNFGVVSNATAAAASVEIMGEEDPIDFPCQAQIRILPSVQFKPAALYVKFVATYECDNPNLIL